MQNPQQVLVILYFNASTQGGFMNHLDLLKEADIILQHPREARYEIAKFLEYKENEKLNHFKLYECPKKFSWYIETDDFEELLVYPYGFFCVDYLNQLISLKSKDSFISYEKRMRNGAKSKKEVNPTFDKKYRLFLWNYNELSNYDTSNHISDSDLETMYNECCWLWKYIGEDVEELIKYLEFQKENIVPTQQIYGIYLFVQKLFIKVFLLQSEASVFRKGKNDEAARGTLEEWESMIDHDFIVETTAHQFRYMGYTTLKFDDTEEFCKKYDIRNLIFLVAEDLLHFMLHQTTHSFGFCPECGRIFTTVHGNQKHCPACNLIIRQKQRKQNKARYLHKNITDYINNYRSEDENASKLFRDESNYYWNIVQRKNPKKINEYSQDIKTEADYINWLEKKYAEIKSKK